MATPSDPLLSAAIDGNSAAQDELARRNHDRLRAFVSHRIGATVRRETEIDDICQDTFLRVFRSLDSMPRDATIDAFWMRLQRNAMWEIRSRGARARGFVGESVAGDSPHESTPEASLGDVTRGDLTAWLRRLATNLPAGSGDIVVRRLDGASFRDIADDLGDSEAAVRKRYSRAYQALLRVVEGREAS